MSPAARKGSGWSQADAADRLGISLELYARIERDQTTSLERDLKLPTFGTLVAR
ncbi:helix-turn-helix domain-containing protein [Sorangium sp. So ce861]|uniref:helix-turn-helix domain-containing protein n=1 Tax=Sorangium sp. So ce861 TaxID=3133323 RepID=UPI003F5D7FFB